MNSNRYKLANKISSATPLIRLSTNLVSPSECRATAIGSRGNASRNPLPIREIGGGPFWPVTGEPRAVIRRFCRSPLWLENCRGQQQIDG